MNGDICATSFVLSNAAWPTLAWLSSPLLEHVKGDVMVAVRFVKTSLGSASLVVVLGFAVTLVAAALWPGRSIAADQSACSVDSPAAIEVKVENVRSSKGLITAVLYGDNPEAFLKRGQRLDRIRVAAQEGETLLCLEAPTVGRYSIALYHDENGNKELDRNFLGIPSEGYGFSNNPGFRFGKPEQEETLFTTVEDGLTSLRISILYL